MPIRQITIIGTGLIGGSFGLALKKRRFPGRIIGCDRDPVLKRAREAGAIDEGRAYISEAVAGSQVILLATPVAAIIDLIGRLAPVLHSKALLTDVGGTKAEIVACAQSAFGKQASVRFLGGHPMAGKENSGVEYADPDLFQGAPWFLTPIFGQLIYESISGEFLELLELIGARIASIDAQQHDQMCAWISHLPQMLSTALAASLVDEFGADAPLLETGGRALREMTRISSSPYSVWRDIALTNKKNIQKALLKLEQRLAHIRENLDTRELAMEFDRAQHLRKISAERHSGTEKKP